MEHHLAEKQRPGGTNQKFIWFCAAFVIISAIVLVFFSYSSPLYYYNISPDDNNFFLVGKMMMHGILPYKDVFEQKGPYVYLLYGLGSLLHGRSLLGMFPFEIIVMTLTFIGVYKIATLFVSDDAAFGLSLFTPLFMIIQPFFDYGGTVEFYFFPAIIWTIYLALKVGHNHFKMTKLELLGQGFLVGVVFFSKYTLLGTWIAFFLFVFFAYLFRRQYREIGKMVVYSGAGFLLAIVPWLLYFLITNSLKAFFHVYFVVNMTSYASTTTFWDKIGTAVGYYFSFFGQSPLILIVGILGIIAVLCAGRNILNWPQKAIFLVMMIVNGVVTVYGHDPATVYPYYLQVYFPYLLVGALIFMIIVIKLVTQKSHFQFKKPWILWVLCIIIVVLTCPLLDTNYQASKLNPGNPSVTLHRDHEKPEPAQVEFGKIIRKHSVGTPSIFVYGRLDSGFYVNADTLPTEYYFQRNNLDDNVFPEMMQEANGVLKHKKVQWVIIRVNDNRHSLRRYMKSEPRSGGKKALKQNYRIVAKHPEEFEGRNVVYYLFERK